MDREERRDRYMAFRMLRSLAKILQSLVDADPLLPKLEHSIVNRFRGTVIHPIFIVGAPRTGSSLLFELLITQYQTAYLTNLAALLHKSPTLSTWLTTHFGHAYRYHGKSQFGYFKGIKAPSEAANIVNNWLNIKSFEWDIVRIRQTASVMSQIMGGPFICKNLWASINITTIDKLFPEAVFIHIQRDLLHVAQSILLARRQLYRDERKWFSVKPYGWEQHSNSSPAQQVVWQIMAIEASIGSSKQTMDSSRFLEVQYRDLCDKPQAVLNSIVKFCCKASIPLHHRRNPDPIQLNSRNRAALPRQEVAALTDIIKEVNSEASDTVRRADL